MPLALEGVHRLLLLRTHQAWGHLLVEAPTAHGAMHGLLRSGAELVHVWMLHRLLLPERASLQHCLASINLHSSLDQVRTCVLASAAGAPSSLSCPARRRRSSKAGSGTTAAGGTGGFGGGGWWASSG